MAVFVSYTRQDSELVGALCKDIELLGHQVWLDERLRGGQEWWDEILDQIRACDVFVWTVSPASVASKACRSELDYAATLGRPILPVKIRGVAMSLAPPRIANAQVVDYSKRDANQALRLAGDLQALPPPTALPDPLPEPPEVPITYLDTFADEVASITPMTADRQRQIVDFLRPIATDSQNVEDADAARSLLRKIHSRSDVTLGAATAIDEILAHPASTQPQAVGYSVPPPPPSARPEPAQSSREPRPPPPVRPPGHERWSGGVFFLLIATTLFCGGIVGIIVGLLNRSDPAKRSQANTLLWIGVAVIAFWLLLIVIGSVQQATCDPTVEVC